MRKKLDLSILKAMQEILIALSAVLSECHYVGGFHILSYLKQILVDAPKWPLAVSITTRNGVTGVGHDSLLP